MHVIALRREACSLRWSSTKSLMGKIMYLLTHLSPNKCLIKTFISHLFLHSSCTDHTYEKNHCFCYKCSFRCKKNNVTVQNLTSQSDFCCFTDIWDCKVTSWPSTAVFQCNKGNKGDSFVNLTDSQYQQILQITKYTIIIIKT